MGYCGLKISGHSGTSFKHRKAFKTQKAYHQRKVRYGSEKYDQQIDEPYKNFTNDVTASWSQRVVKISIKLLSIFGLFFIFICLPYFIYQVVIKIHNNEKIIHQERMDNRQVIKKEAYDVLIKTGTTYLNKGKLNDAQYDFVLALKHNKYGIEARKGLYKVLDLKCSQFGLLCKEAQENKEYLIALGEYE